VGESILRFLNSGVLGLEVGIYIYKETKKNSMCMVMVASFIFSPSFFFSFN
jgi:hypothetical protein